MDIDKIYLTVVVSVFNEELTLKKFHGELSKQLDKLDFITEILYVNDGSSDSSLRILKSLSSIDNKIRIISLSKNYGHEAAMIAGIDNAVGKYIICLDADLQHPPSLIPKMISKAEDGADIVLMKREERKDGHFLIKLFSRIFYELLNKISPVKFENNSSDFFLISSRITHVLKKDFRERTRFLRGYIQLVGFNIEYIIFKAPKRFDGDSKYNFLSLMNLSTDAIISFSKLPLKLGLSLGIIGLISSFFIGGYSFVTYFMGNTPSGYTTIIITLTLVSSIQFILIGFIGIYIGNLFDEIKKRPIYLIDKIIENDKI